jgi:hypothetical protein
VSQIVGLATWPDGVSAARTNPGVTGAIATASAVIARQLIPLL